MQQISIRFTAAGKKKNYFLDLPGASCATLLSKSSSWRAACCWRTWRPERRPRFLAQGPGLDSPALLTLSVLVSSPACSPTTRSARTGVLAPALLVSIALTPALLLSVALMPALLVSVARMPALLVSLALTPALVEDPVEPFARFLVSRRVVLVVAPGFSTPAANLATVGTFTPVELDERFSAPALACVLLAKRSTSCAMCSATTFN